MAAPIRTLTTRLNFQFDRTNLDRFNVGIRSLRQNFVITASELTNLVSKFAEIPLKFAKSFQSLKDLANYSQIALKDLKALQNVALEFQIPETNFQNVIEALTTGIYGALQGENNQIRRLAEQTGINLRKENGQEKNAIDLLQDIAGELRKLDLPSQLNFLRNVPGIGAEFAPRWLELLSLTNEQMQALLEKQQKSVGLFINQEDNTTKALKAWTEFTTEFKKVIELLAITLLPIFTEITKGLSTVLGDVSEKGPIGVLTGLSKVSEQAAPRREQLSKELEQKYPPQPLNILENLLKLELDKRSPLYMLRNQNSSQGIPGNITVTQNIEVTANSSDPQEIATVTSARVKAANQEFWDEQIRQVVNNNPVVE